MRSRTEHSVGLHTRPSSPPSTVLEMCLKIYQKVRPSQICLDQPDNFQIGTKSTPAVLFDVNRPVSSVESTLSVRKVWVRLLGRLNRHSVANGSPLLRHFFGVVLPRRQAVEMGPATRHTPRRDTASMIKIRFV